MGSSFRPGASWASSASSIRKTGGRGTVESLENGEVLTITYDRLLELYFQNPEFGYYFLRLTTERLMQNIARLEALAENRAKLRGFSAWRKARS